MATIKLSGERGPAKRLQYNPRPAPAPSLLNKPYIMFPEISTNILARILLACLVNCRQLSSVAVSCVHVIIIVRCFDAWLTSSVYNCATTGGS